MRHVLSETYWFCPSGAESLEVARGAGPRSPCQRQPARRATSWAVPSLMFTATRPCQQHEKVSLPSLLILAPDEVVGTKSIWASPYQLSVFFWGLAPQQSVWITAFFPFFFCHHFDKINAAIPSYWLWSPGTEPHKASLLPASSLPLLFEPSIVRFRPASLLCVLLSSYWIWRFHSGLFLDSWRMLGGPSRQPPSQVLTATKHEPRHIW